MLKFNYGCDAGSIMLGTDEFKAHYSNGIGDGGYTVFIAETVHEIEDVFKLEFYDSWHFIDCVEGTFNVYDYDCSGAEILVQLTGRYAVYCKNGNIALEKWN